MSTQTLSGNMSLIDMSGIKIWNGEREVNDAALKEQLRRNSAIVSVKAQFPKEYLRPFSRLKMRIRRTLEDEGYPFMSGFAIPADRTKHVMGRVSDYVSEAEQAREHFLSNYDSWRQDLLDAAEDDDWREKLDEAMLTAQQVAERINFEVTPLNVTISDADPEGLSRKLNSLHDEIIHNAAKTAQEFLDNNQNPQAMRRSSCKKLKQLKQKLSGFKWLHNVQSSGVVLLLDHAIQASQSCADSTLPESVYWQVMGPVGVIADEKRLQRYLDGEIQLTQLQRGPLKEDPEKASNDKDEAIAFSDEGINFGIDEDAEPTDDSGIANEPEVKDEKVTEETGSVVNFDDFPEKEEPEIPHYDEAAGFSF